jgi:hypothetical protein
MPVFEGALPAAVSICASGDVRAQRASCGRRNVRLAPLANVVVNRLSWQGLMMMLLQQLLGILELLPAGTLDHPELLLQVSSYCY